MEKENIIPEIEEMVPILDNIASRTPQIEKEIQSAVEKLQQAILVLEKPEIGREGNITHMQMMESLREYLVQNFRFKELNPKPPGKKVSKDGRRVPHKGKSVDLFGKSSDGRLIVGEAEVKKGGSDNAINKWTDGTAFKMLQEWRDEYGWSDPMVFIATNVLSTKFAKNLILSNLQSKALEYGFHEVHLLYYDE
ncbi:MAG: hypothetical protein V3R93_05910, partial [Candidatus Hydrothermarchaeaceae archaeon]